MTVTSGGFPGGYNRNNFEAPDGIGGSYRRRNPSEDNNFSKRKFAGSSCTEADMYGVPKMVVPLADLSASERKNLIQKLQKELEQVQSYQKSVEVPRVNIAASSSTCESSRPKSFGKSRCSAGPGKKVMPLNAVKPAPVTTATMLVMKQCEALLKRLMSHQYAWIFNTPVDVIKLNIPDYFTIIKFPMDLGTVKSKLTSGTYSCPYDFAADVRLTFTNAMTYNPTGNDVHIMADTLCKFFEVRWKNVEKKLSGTKTLISPTNSDIHDQKNIKTDVPVAKKRKIDAVNQESVSEASRRVMTTEDKCKLGMDLESLEEFPMHIINFLRKHTSNEVKAGDDEIEIDINDLSDDALFQLRKLLDEHMQKSLKKDSNTEPCEIELLHGSGPGNFSGQHCDESELVDEDVDIGENEPPISSISNSRIDKDVRLENPSGSSSSGSVSEDPKVTSSADTSKRPAIINSEPPSDGKPDVLPPHRMESDSGLNHMEEASQGKSGSVEEAECHQDGNSGPSEKQLPADKLYRAALLKNRFADLILKAREKTLTQNDKLDPEKLRREKEELELQKKKEKARLQAEAKAAEEARRRAEAQAAAESAAEAKRKLEVEREAARQALLEMEQSVEINENSKFLKDLEMLKGGKGKEEKREAEEEEEGCNGGGGLSSFDFGGGNPLEQLGLFMKHDEEEEDGEALSFADDAAEAAAAAAKDIEEGEID